MVDGERRLTRRPATRRDGRLIPSVTMFTSTFLKDAAERAVSTFAQTLVALVGTDAVDILTVDLGDSLKAAAVAGGLSLIKSYAAARGPIGDDSASAVDLKG